MKPKIYSFLLLLNSLIAFNLNAETIKIGVSVDAQLTIMQEVKKIAKEKYNLDIKLIEFSDYVLPNEALNNGDLDANTFQHQPYLDSQIKSRGYKLISVAKTYSVPLAIYSKKIKSLSDLKNNSTIGISNDSTNGGRALLLLQEKNLIKLKENVGTTPTLLDIIENPKKLKIIEVLAAQLPRSLDDLDMAIIGATHAIYSGLNFKKNTITVGKLNSTYSGIIAIKESDKNKPWVEQLIKSYHSQEIKDFIIKTFNGVFIPDF